MELAAQQLRKELAMGNSHRVMQIIPRISEVIFVGFEITEKFSEPATNIFAALGDACFIFGN